MEQANDELNTLLARVALQDHAALRRLHELTSAHLMAIAVRVLRRRELAEEALQEVFVSVWSKAASYSPEAARPMTWLIAITRHRAFDLLRSRAASEHELRSVDTDEMVEPVDPRPHVEEAVDARRLRGAMGALSAAQSQSLALAYYHGLPLSEVAELLGVPLNSVKSRVHRAMARLRLRLTTVPATPWRGVHP